MSDQVSEVARPVSALRSAAWIPGVRENAQRWEEMQRIAVRWIVEQAAVNGVEPLVFYTARKVYGSIGPVDDLAARCGFSYPREVRSRRGAVLAVCPDAASLYRASVLARGSALVVLEGTGMPLAGWAAATGAKDLSGGYPSVPVIDARAHAAINSAVTFGGHNGWTGSYERKHAREVLGPVTRDGLIGVDTAVGYALGYAKVTEHGPKNLRAVLERLTR